MVLNVTTAEFAADGRVGNTRKQPLHLNSCTGRMSYVSSLQVLEEDLGSKLLVDFDQFQLLAQ